MNETKIDLKELIEAVVKAVISSANNQNLEDALLIRDEIKRLPDYLVTEVLNGVILELMMIDPDLCRWFILDIFLREADPDGKADVAERINLLMADLHSA